ncbi:hypothetical protein SRABI13_01145 [Erwinia aphidicola]|nr:hypothetical protein SRABI13_01145 [Erwinia aphidicola]
MELHVSITTRENNMLIKDVGNILDENNNEDG